MLSECGSFGEASVANNGFNATPGTSASASASASADAYSSSAWSHSSVSSTAIDIRVPGMRASPSPSSSSSSSFYSTGATSLTAVDFAVNAHLQALAMRCVASYVAASPTPRDPLIASTVLTPLLEKLGSPVEVSIGIVHYALFLFMLVHVYT